MQQSSINKNNNQQSIVNGLCEKDHPLASRKRTDDGPVLWFVRVVIVRDVLYRVIVIAVLTENATANRKRMTAHGTNANTCELRTRTQQQERSRKARTEPGSWIYHLLKSRLHAVCCSVMRHASCLSKIKGLLAIQLRFLRYSCCEDFYACKLASHEGPLCFVRFSLWWS